jgi:putative polyhydroxyalkanoate system protein
MATIDISRTHNLGAETAKERAAALADSMKEKLGIAWRWDGDRIKFDAPSGMAKGTTGTISVAATSVRVEIDLPFLLRAMKGTIESKVNEKLDKLAG